MGKKRPQSLPPVATDKVIPLNSYDDNDVNASIVLYFMIRFDDVLDPEKLRAAFEKLLNREGWRKLGARLRINAAGKLEYHVPEQYDEKRPAFAYSHVNRDMPIAKHPLGSQVPSGYAGEGPSVVIEPRKVADLAGVETGPKVLADYVGQDRGQLGLHIESFTDATLVTLNWLHTLWDAMGRREFLLSWIAILEGRDDDVRPFHGFDTDPLKELGLHPKEAYELANRRLSLFQLIIFGLRRFWEEWRHEEGGRVLCVPSSFLQKLREQAMADLKEEAAKDSRKVDEDFFLSDGDLLVSWIGRSIVKHSPIRHSRTIAFFNAFGMRGLLQKDGTLPSDEAYVSNCVTSVYTLVSAGDVVNRPLGYTASRIRQTLKVQGTREQLEAGLALIKESYEATGYPAIFGDATMQMVIISNWSKARFFEMDFSAAIVEGSGDPSREGSKKRGKPTYIQPVGYSDYSKRCAFNVSGKDNDGNYWLAGGLRKAAWERMEEALKRGEY